MQVPANARFSGSWRLGRKVECRAHAREHLRMGNVSLGTNAIRFGEPACLQRVHFDQGACPAKRCFEGLVIRPRWLEHDPRHRSLAQPFDLGLTETTTLTPS